MSHHPNSKPLALAIGTAFAASLAAGSVGAAENPFQQAELATGYMLADSHEGKCGGKNKSDMEGKCGGEKKAGSEGKCGGEKKAGSEGKCGGEKKKSDMEGKCGEGKCGGNK